MHPWCLSEVDFPKRAKASSIHRTSLVIIFELMSTAAHDPEADVGARAANWWFVLCGWLPFCKSFFCAGRFVRSSLVFGLLARRTWPLALMVSTNQVPFRNSNSKRSGQSKGRLGFRADKVPSPHWSCKLLCLRRSFKLFSLCMAHFGLGQPRSCGRFCLP